MKVAQLLWSPGSGWQSTGESLGAATLVLFFGAPEALADPERLKELSAFFPKARLVGCTTGGEIHGKDVLDGAISASAFSFQSTDVRAETVQVGDYDSSQDLGKALAAKFPAENLKLLFVLSDGIQVNGSELVRGLTSVLGNQVAITGGLAGDGARFGTTRTGIDGNLDTGIVAAVGFYGEHLSISHGSAGGWDAFGPKRKITKSAGNILYELDGRPALELYKKYLGDEAAGLPGSALLFPLMIHPENNKDAYLVRTVLGVDEDRQAMIFAGDVPQGYSGQLMRGNFDRLIDGAATAATQAYNDNSDPAAAILISCIGRKLLLGQRIGEEVETVSDILGASAITTGFYSYGEISPNEGSGFSELHNQTMTVTLIRET